MSPGCAATLGGQGGGGIPADGKRRHRVAEYPISNLRAISGCDHREPCSCAHPDPVRRRTCSGLPARPASIRDLEWGSRRVPSRARGPLGGWSRCCKPRRLSPHLGPTRTLRRFGCG
jgi:hypothetical protein